MMEKKLEEPDTDEDIKAAFRVYDQEGEQDQSFFESYQYVKINTLKCCIIFLVTIML